MIDVLYIVSEDAIRTKADAAAIFEGQPLKLNAEGKLEVAASTDKVFGIAKCDANSYHNYAFGELGSYGTGKISVVKKGTVRVKSSVYGQVEVDTSMTGPGSVFTKELFVAAPATPWAIDQVCYVADATPGLITNVGPAQSVFGKVTATPAMTGGWLEIEVDCPTFAATALA